MSPLGAKFALSMALAAVGLLTIVPAAGAAYPAGQNGRVLFWHSTASLSDVITIAPDGSAPANLSTSDAEPNFDPSYSPDGRRIAFSRRVSSAPLDYEVWVMNADGTGAHSVAAGGPGIDWNPAFSPDGRSIVFGSTRDPAGYLDVWIMNADGSGARNLTPGFAGTDDDASFSPDGSRILFESDRSGPDVDLYTMNLDGSAVTPVTDNGFAEGGSSWSPDGGRIAFGSNMGGGADFDVWTVSPGGTGPINLTPTNPVSNGSPSFSPDGKQIAFASLGDGDFDIYTMSSAGGPAADISNAFVGQDTNPDWQRIARCGGRDVTITGDDGPDKIKGTKKADVIMGFAGKDRIKGLAGNDRICGGLGKDRLVGGKGARDRCAGGQGRDSGASCEKGKL